jgi:transcriptional regulator with GAF, ATPase, and Fis domain
MKLPPRKEDAEMLFRALRELVPENDLDRLLEKVIAISNQILETDRALLFLYDTNSNALVFKYGVNVEEYPIEQALELSSTILERAKKGEIFMLSDSQDTEKSPATESIFRYDIKTVLCSPIVSDEKLLGVIYADTKGRSAILDAEQEAYFLSFVDFIAEIISRVLELHEKGAEIAYLKKRLSEETIFPEIIGQSAVIDDLKEKVMRIVSVTHPVSVLIVGESGTGKELFARAIHRGGTRAGRPFNVVNCAALPASLMESELFGYEKGAFTGAHTRKLGFFEVANGGIVFLDEIGELPPELQSKLLRALQFGTFTRVGGRTEIRVDLQFICATSRDLYVEMEEGRFRKALFHRLAVEVLRVPPLRRRREDILPLANHFMNQFAGSMGKNLTGIDIRAQKLLQERDYTDNNVRELKNVLERAVLNATTGRITTKDIVFSDELLIETGPPPASGDSWHLAGDEFFHLNDDFAAEVFEESKDASGLPREDKPYYRALGEMEKKLILLSLHQAGWKIKPASRLLGINHVSFRSKLSKLIGDLLDEAGGDTTRISKKYGIPLSFLSSKKYRTSE